MMTEKLLFEIFEQFSQPVLVLNEDQTVRFANKSAVARIIKPGAAYKGKKCYQVFRKSENNCPDCFLCNLSVDIPHTETVYRNGEMDFHVRSQLIVNKRSNMVVLIFDPVLKSGAMAGKQLTFSITDFPGFNQELLEHVPVPVMLTGDDGLIRHVNNIWSGQLGYSPQEVMNKPFNRIISPENEYLRNQASGKALDTLLYDNELVFTRHPKGEQKVYSISIASWKQKGENLYIWLFNRVNNEEATRYELKQRENYLKSIFRAAPVGIGVTVNRILYFVNNRLCQMTGYSVSELLAKNARMLYENDAEYKRVGEEKYDQIRKSGTGTVETQWVARDGSKLDILLSSTPIDPGNASRGVTFTALDITHRKEAERRYRRSEERYKSFIQNAADAIVIVDAESGMIVDFNQKAVDLLGYDPEELIRMSQSELHLPEIREQTAKNFESVARSELSIDQQLILHKSGRRIPVEINPSIHTDESGNRLVLGVFRDLSYRQEYQQALEESEQRYKVLFESVQEGIIITNRRNGRIEYANPAMCSFLDYPMEKLLDLVTDDIHSPDQHQLISERLAQTPEGEVAVLQEVVCLTSSGEIVYADMQAREITVSGEVKIAGFFVDATQRRDHEQKLLGINRQLASATELFRTIAQNIPDIILRVNRDMRIIYVSPNVEEYAGISDRQLIGTKLTEQEELDPEFTYNREKDLRDVLKSGKPYISVISAKTMKTRNILEWRMIPEFDKEGRVDTVLNLIRDITHSMQTEEELNNLFNLSADMICVVNAGGNFHKINPSFERVLGYSEKEMLETPFHEFVHPDDVENTRQVIRDKIGKGEPTITFENRFQCKDGSYKWFSWVAQQTGREERLFAIARDVTERKKTMRELIEAKERAEESDKLKSAFLANMSHEIRTPMNAIMGFSTLLQREQISIEKRKHYTQIIRNRSEDLLNIINDILDISKIEAGQIEIHEEELSLTGMLNDLQEEFGQKLNEMPGHAVDFKLLSAKDAGDETIMADSLRVRQVMSNLLDNALKFTREGHVHFGYRKLKDKLELFVEDTGIGIPLHKQQNIFERFRQAEESTTRKYGGNGLGLAISKALVEMMGGKIGLTSEEDRGSRFFFTLPYTPAMMKPAKKEDKPEVKIKALNNKRILVVEDDAKSQEYLRIVLEMEGANLVFASSGADALVLFESDPKFNIILMDIQLPDIDGYEVTRRIRKEDKSIPIIAQTAFAMTEDMEKCQAAGCTDFLSKPIRAEHLVEMMLRYGHEGDEVRSKSTEQE